MNRVRTDREGWIGSESDCNDESMQWARKVRWKNQHSKSKPDIATVLYIHQGGKKAARQLVPFQPLFAEDHSKFCHLRATKLLATGLPPVSISTTSVGDWYPRMTNNRRSPDLPVGRSFGHFFPPPRQASQATGGSDSETVENPLDVLLSSRNHPRGIFVAPKQHWDPVSGRMCIRASPSIRGRSNRISGGDSINLGHGASQAINPCDYDPAGKPIPIRFPRETKLLATVFV